MLTIRPPAVAGSFYPGQAQSLAKDLQAMLTASGPAPDAVHTVPKAVIVPHAGYVYSGTTAALAYARIAAGAAAIRRVVLLGPVHRVPVRGLALPGGDAFATPLGAVPLDAQAMESIAQLRAGKAKPRTLIRDGQPQNEEQTAG